jgi:hypothetical protein
MKITISIIALGILAFILVVQTAKYDGRKYFGALGAPALISWDADWSGTNLSFKHGLEIMLAYTENGKPTNVAIIKWNLWPFSKIESTYHYF